MHDHPPANRYLLLFVLVLTGLLAWIGLPDHPAPRVLQVLLEGAAVVVALGLVGVSRRRVSAVAVAVGALMAVAGVVSTGQDGRPGRALVAGTHLLLVVVVPPLLLRSLRNHRTVSVPTVLGALTVYLLLGQFFAAAYSTLDAIDPAPFFADGTEGTPAEMSYFSFVTLSTVGFGDLTAVSRAGRMLVVLEALLGQFYLVTVVALTVSRLGRGQPDGSQSSQ